MNGKHMSNRLLEAGFAKWKLGKKSTVKNCKWKGRNGGLMQKIKK
jgi:hypothetical protein